MLSNVAKHPQYLLILVAFSIIVKLLVFTLLLHAGADFTLPDSGSYLDPANTFVSKGIFWSNKGLWMRTPLYPLIISGVYYLIGKSLFYVIFLQIFMSGLLVINAYRITALLSNSRIGLFAAALVSVNYLFISYANLIMTDLLFAVMFSFIFYYIIKFTQHKNDYVSLASTGILLALCTLMRPITYYLTPLLAMALLLYTFKQEDLVTALKYFLILMIPSLVLVGAWQVRNKEIIGTYQYTNIDAVNLYHYYAADNIAHVKKISIKQAQLQLENQAYQLFPEDFKKRYAYFRSQGMKILWHYPQWTALQFVSGLMHTLIGNDYILLYYNQNSFIHGRSLKNELIDLNIKSFWGQIKSTDYLKAGAVILFSIFTILVLGFSLYYFFASFSQDRNIRYTLFSLMLIIGYFLLVSSNFCSLARFRLPFEVLFDSFAIVGYCEFIAKRSTISKNETYKLNIQNANR